METNALEKFFSTIRSGRIALGSVVTFFDPAVTELSADTGFDFCWIDGEHGTIDRATAQAHMMALRGTGCASFYRVPACDHTEIKRIIDFAPAGIIVPMIMNADDARLAVSACRYPLLGDRGCGYRRGNRYGSIPGDEYWEMAKREPLVILQIEHIEAVRNLDAILKVPGVGSILVGPYDLSASMGKPGLWDDPEVSSTLDEVCRKSRAVGILLGAYAECKFDVWKKRGVQYMGIKNDTSAMRLGFEMMMQEARAGFGEGRGE